MFDEFTLIEKLLSRSRSLRHQGVLIIPPGDDAALISAIDRPVVTTDTHREGIHFRTDWQTYEEIGKKVVAVTLSDLAASFATPIALFVNLALPASISEEEVLSLYNGIYEALDQYGCALGGGNISQAGELALDMFAIGNCYSRYYPARSGAKPGDGVYVSGPVGSARGGLISLLHDDPDFPELIHAFKFSKARFDAAKILHDHKVQCVMDLSDGLLGDVTHMAKASSVTITLDPDLLPFSKELIALARKYNQIPEKLAFQGGEEYELVFTCTPEVFSQIQKKLPSAFPVGSVSRFKGTHVVQPFSDISSYQHGKKSY